MFAPGIELTFKHNLNLGRHRWLRLTPAYSVKLVQSILEEVGKPDYVLDPFSGTGTSGLVCAEEGINCDLVDINPFLVWLAKAKTRQYTVSHLETANELVNDAIKKANGLRNQHDLWIPPMNHIERWWHPERLTELATLFNGLRNRPPSPALDLALLAFCRLAIKWSNAAFNHQSVSFKKEYPAINIENERGLIYDDYHSNINQIIDDAGQPLLGEVGVHYGDSRCVQTILQNKYNCVITSPPYPNRMSYIRELRPYMYWLGFLKEAKEAGNLDWETIGGTWGVATSRLTQWKPEKHALPHDDFEKMVSEIGKESPLLANYVHKYFLDMFVHLTNLRQILAHGAKVFYIVGNSKFYDVVVPVEQVYASMLRHLGFVNVEIRMLRKRSSKKELYEFAVFAEWK